MATSKDQLVWELEVADKATKTLHKTEKATKKVDKAMDDMGAAAKKAADDSKDLHTNLDRVDKGAKDAGDGVEKMTDEVKKGSKALRGMEKDAKGTAKAVAKADREAAGFSTSGLGKGVDSAAGKVQNLADGFGMTISKGAIVQGALLGVGAGAAMGAKKLGEMSIAQANHVKQLTRSAEAAGLTTRAYQELDVAFKKYGADTEDIADAFGSLSERVMDAKKGSGAAAEALQTLGISSDELEGKNIHEIFLRIADGVQAADDDMAAMAASSNLFGEDLSKKMLPALKKGGEEFERIAEEADRYGQILDKDAIKSSKMLSEEMDKFDRVLDGAGNTLATAFTPFLTVAVMGLNDLAEVLGLIEEEGPDAVEETADEMKTLKDESDKAAHNVDRLAKALGDIKMPEVDNQLGVFEQGAQIDAAYATSQQVLIDRINNRHSVGGAGLSAADKKIVMDTRVEYEKFAKLRQANNRKTVETLYLMQKAQGDQLATENEILDLENKRLGTQSESARAQVDADIKILELEAEIDRKKAAILLKARRVKEMDDLSQNSKDSYLAKLDQESKKLDTNFQKRKKNIEKEEELAVRKANAPDEKGDDGEAAKRAAEEKDTRWRNIIAEAEIKRAKATSKRQTVEEEFAVRQLVLARKIEEGTITSSEAEQEMIEAKQAKEKKLSDLRKSRLDQTAEAERKHQEDKERREDEAHNKRMDQLEAELALQDSGYSAVASSFDMLSSMKGEAISKEVEALRTQQDQLGQDQEQRREAIDREIKSLENYKDVGAGLAGMASNLQTMTDQWQTMSAEGATGAEKLEASVSAGGAATSQFLEQMGVGYREVAGIRALFESGAAIAAYASGNIPGGIGHTAAAAVFGGMAVAGPTAPDPKAGAKAGGSGPEYMSTDEAFEKQKRAHFEALREAQRGSREFTTYIDQRNSYFLERSAVGRRQAREGLNEDPRLSLGG